MQAELERAGRDPKRFGAEASVDFSGKPERWNRELELWKEMGGTHLSLRAMDTASEAMGFDKVGYKGPQDYIDALRTFREAIDA
jgi:hypothetical protein